MVSNKGPDFQRDQAINSAHAAQTLQLIIVTSIYSDGFLFEEYSSYISTDDEH